jgi:hypothetical protein
LETDSGFPKQLFSNWASKPTPHMRCVPSNYAKEEFVDVRLRQVGQHAGRPKPAEGMATVPLKIFWLIP